MPRWLFPALFAVYCALSPAFAQFGGIRFPGGGRNQGGQGQQNPNGSQNTNKVYGPTETLTGSLREISSSSLVLDAGDDRIVLVQIQQGTKYLSTMDKVKASDFEPGDHVTVEATRDDSDHYYSKTITMNKKGTAEEKSAAMQAANSSSHGGGSSSDSDSDPDRPKLHRANADGGGSGGSSSGNSSDSGNSGATSSASDSDPDRPKLHRTNSDSSDSTSASQTSNSGDSSASATRSAPVSSSGSGSTDSSTVTRRRPAVSSDSTSQAVSTPIATDDSGPPVLRRGTAPTASSSDSSANTSSAPSGSGGARPSLAASDDNGVTRSPVAPPPPSESSGGSRGDSRVERSRPGDSDGDPVIEQARDAAFSFSETLPNYVVKQVTNRYGTSSATRGRTTWQPLDIVTTDLVYEDGKERYTNVLVNGKPTRSIEDTGSWSEGEFASMLQAILAPETRADFRNQRPVTISNRAAYRYDYTVEQPRSTWSLHADGQTYAPSYTGAIWVDKATYRVLRIEIAARNLPRNFPIDTAESSIDYDFITIGDRKVLLPSGADSLSCARGSSDCTKNHTEYHNYKKYGADTSITFGGETDK